MDNLDDYDNKAVRDREEQLKSLQQQAVNELLIALAYYISISRLLKHEFPEEYFVTKGEILSEIEEFFPDPTHREHLKGILFGIFKG